MKRALGALLLWSTATRPLAAQDAVPPPDPPPAIESAPAAAAPLAEAPPTADAPPPAEAPTPLPPPPSPELTAQIPLSESELEALGLSTADAGTDTTLYFSGFVDFTFAFQFTEKDSVWRASGSAPPHSTFYLGNANLYLRKNLTESLRTLGEIRFSFLPNGTVDALTRETISTSVRDYNDFGRAMRWGGIQMQRFYLEWTMHPLISVRGGQFLTPYGIWNVDHGTPTYIPVQRPFVVGLAWFPERQTGLEFFGRWDAVTDASLGYHLTLSNGTGPISEYLDLDENKAIGARVYLEYRALGELRIGGSVYFGRYTDAVNGFYVDAQGSTTAREDLLSQYDELAWAGDILWKYKGLHIQSEWITYQRAYTTRGRTGVSPMTIMSGVRQLPADTFGWGGYGLIGYRFAWFGLMPFFVIEHIGGVLDMAKVSNITLQAGLNARPVDVLTLKVQWYHVQFSDALVYGQGPLDMIQTQVAWTF